MTENSVRGWSKYVHNKSKMVGWPLFWKNDNPYLSNGLTDRYEIFHDDPPNRTAVKNQYGRRRLSWNLKQM